MGSDYRVTDNDWGREAGVVVARAMEREQVRVVGADGSLLAIVGSGGVGGLFDAEVPAVASATASAGAMAPPIASATQDTLEPTPVDLGAAWRD